jgi:hypothetical protein
MWKPDASQIKWIQKLVEIGLPKCRPRIVGLNCDLTILQAVADATPKRPVLV